MKPAWRAVVTIILISLMGFSIVSSANNGSNIGRIIKDSTFIQKSERKISSMFKEALK